MTCSIDWSSPATHSENVYLQMLFGKAQEKTDESFNNVCCPKCSKTDQAVNIPRQGSFANTCSLALF